MFHKKHAEPVYELLPRHSIIGIIGGGQLGRMMAIAAAKLGYHAHIYSDDAQCPAKEVAFKTTIAPYTDKIGLNKFARQSNVITVEFENIPIQAAQFLSKHQPFFPSPDIFAFCQHRGKEKDFARQCGAQTADFRLADNEKSLLQAVRDLGLPVIIKHTTQGYDGKGQYRIDTIEACEGVWQEANQKELIVESVVPFTSEASIIIARSQSGEMALYPVVDNVHKNGILTETSAPSRLPKKTQDKMIALAKTIAQQSQLIGLLAIEFFVLKNGEVLVNEMAPRPHNSGHWSMDGCNISQFEQIIRICANMPLITPHIVAPTVMTNLLGGDIDTLDKWMQDDQCRLHIYGKRDARHGRKMGHVNKVLHA